MINYVKANKKGFKSVAFDKFFNVVLADKAETSDEKDSRNGLGKTSFIEIIHFCFGADFKKTLTIKKPELEGWVFLLSFNHQGNNYEVERSTAKPDYVIVSGHTEILALPPIIDEEGKKVYKVKDWNDVLGKLFFNLSLDSTDTHNPTFRGLFPYFARKSPDAYTDPFSSVRSQKSWQKKVLNSYLLGLSWEYSRDWHHLEMKEDDIKSLKRAQKSGFVGSLIGSVGKLEAEKARLQKEAQIKLDAIRTFKVHPQYADIEREANRLRALLQFLPNFVFC